MKTATKTMTKAQMIRCVEKAKKGFKARGLELNGPLLLSQFGAGGMAPRSKADAKRRKEECRKHFLARLYLAEMEQAKKHSAEVKASKCFSMMKVVESLEDADIQGLDVEGPCVVFPVMHAAGTGRPPKNADRYFHWGFVGFERGSWFAESCGSMFWTDSLREAVIFVYSDAVAEGVFVDGL